jgi:uncharacterized membrane protein
LRRSKPWAYPAFMITLGLLISYQSYKLLHVFSLGLMALTILDGIVVVLAWHEYRLTSKTDTERLRRLAFGAAKSFLKS